MAASTDFNLEEECEGFVSDFLSHYGVKGMKWGVRRDRATQKTGSRGAFKRSKPEPSEDKKKVSKIQTKVTRGGNTSALSNDELRTAIERLNLEQQYSRLTDNPTLLNSGKDFVLNAGRNIGKQQVQRVANQYATQQVDEFMKKQRK